MKVIVALLNAFTNTQYLLNLINDRKVDEGKARNTSEEKQTFAERETEMLLSKLDIAPTSKEHGSKPKDVSTKVTVESDPDKNQPNLKYNPSLEAMQGELGTTRRTGELYSNEYGPDLSGKSFPRKDMLMDPGVNVGDKGLTSDKEVLDPTYKSFQQIPPIESQIYQVQHGEVKKNHRYDEVGSDSDGESSSERQSEQFVSDQPSQLPTGIKNDSGGSDFKDKKKDEKDDDGAYGGIQADVSGNYLVSDSKNNQKDEENDNALGNQNDIGGMRMDETDAGRRHSLEREIAQNLRQQQATFTPARPTGGATSSPLVVANAGKEDPDKMLNSSLDIIKKEVNKIETQIKQKKGNDDTDATPLPDPNVVVELNSRPLASRKHDTTVRIIEERNERVKKIFDCDDEPKGRLKNLNEQNVKDLLELSDKKPGLKGGFGEIYVSREKVPGIDMQLVLKKVAIESDGPDRNDKDLKVQKLRSLTSVCFINYVFTREKLCARAMHYGIVPLFGIQENSNNFYFLSPFMVNGNLNHAIEEDNKWIASGKPPKLDAFQRLRNMFQIASAIDFLHTAIPEIRGMIFHRDVKSLNIVLDEFLNARIIDFGLAREMKFGVDNTKTTRYYATLAMEN
ncbi:serine/threonine-protein kinase pakF-like [Ruditapes philippinarum]|uniref:serine/threonine-protein kinase pakF-like n=1 Tax=Ruditapes philippinarum TaxID=129788 RepID=UPI00295B0C28|nr:serine/threonine-protein kinase pakF-like [Ruditapes philippinarum]